MRRLPLVLMLAALLPLGACRPVPPQADAAPAPVATVAADDNLNAVAWVQRSVEYRTTVTGIYRAAAAQLDAALASGEDALDPAERRPVPAGLPPAVVMDVDETVLDNSPYQARLVADGGEYADASWDAWVAEGRARAVPGVLEFAREAQARGITILYISNRGAHLKDATLANLRAVGMPVADDTVFYGLGLAVPGCEQKGSEKLCRRRLAAGQYRIVMQFGDQLGDFVQVAENTPAARAALATRHGDWWGRRWWMLPNPTYGSWEPALFGNQWRLPRTERRGLKRNSLEK